MDGWMAVLFHSSIYRLLKSLFKVPTVFFFIAATPLAVVVVLGGEIRSGSID